MMLSTELPPSWTRAGPERHRTGSRGLWGQALGGALGRGVRPGAQGALRYNTTTQVIEKLSGNNLRIYMIATQNINPGLIRILFEDHIDDRE